MQTPETSDSDVDVRLVSDEADAVVSILRARASGRLPADSGLAGLFQSEGYRHLAERERSFHRPFTDSTFAAFVFSDTLLARAPELEQTLAKLEHVDVRAAAAEAHAYLPPRTPLHARLYLEIKPITNSFVFTGSDSIPSIFLYVQPRERPAQLENTLAHELHHIGLNAACPDRTPTHVSPAEGMLLRFLGAFGEGEAMLAAAGSPNVNPHAVDGDSIQQRWDRDVSRAGADIAEFSQFFTAVLDGHITSADSVRSRASTYFGYQGPWYTVGWLMASTVEREFGRQRLIEDLCDPVRLMTDYNLAATRLSSRETGVLPTWSAPLLARLAALRDAAR